MDIERLVSFRLEAPHYVVQIVFNGWAMNKSESVDELIMEVEKFLPAHERGPHLVLRFPDGEAIEGSPEVVLRGIDTWRKSQGI